MARSLENKVNVEAPDTDYPYGRIRDNNGTGNGTKVNENVYGDFHQFFAKMFAESSLVYNELPDNDYTGFQYYEALIIAINNNNSAASGGIISTGVGAPVLKTKVIEIGDWNMDTDASCLVAHGIADKTKIRNISILIRDDANTEMIPLDYELDVHTGSWFPAGTWYVSGGSIAMNRNPTRHFDDASYSATSFNRGWITIQYAV